MTPSSSNWLMYLRTVGFETSARSALRRGRVDLVILPGDPVTYWFDRTRGIVPNHVVHADVERVADACRRTEPLAGRVMVVRKAERIDIECVVRGYLAGGGWRQYQRTGRVNGIALPAGLRQNEELPEPIFTPAAKNEVGHDEDITFAEMEARVGGGLAARLREASLELYVFARAHCAERGVILGERELRPRSRDRQPGQGTRANLSRRNRLGPAQPPAEAAPGRGGRDHPALPRDPGAAHRTQPRGVDAMIKAHVHVTVKEGVLDPQGKAVAGALGKLGFEDVATVRVGRYLVLELATDDRVRASEQVKKMCEALLANPVVEDYAFELEAIGKAGGEPSKTPLGTAR